MFAKFCANNGYVEPQPPLPQVSLLLLHFLLYGVPQNHYFKFHCDYKKITNRNSKLIPFFGVDRQITIINVIKIEKVALKNLCE